MGTLSNYSGGNWGSKSSSCWFWKFNSNLMYLLSALCEKSTDKWWVGSHVPKFSLPVTPGHALLWLTAKTQQIVTCANGFDSFVWIHHPIEYCISWNTQIDWAKTCGYFCSSVIRHCPLSYKAGNSASQQIIRHTYVLSRSKPPLVSIKGKKIRKSVLKAQIKDKRKRKEWTLTLKWRGIVANEIIRGPEI